jgi:hypothetical protein
MTDVRRPRRASATGTVLTVLAAAVVWVALVLPDERQYLTAGAFVRVPIEAVALLALAVVLPRRAGRVVTVVAVVAGALLGLVLLATVLNIGFNVVFVRDFDPVVDWAYLGPGLGVLRDTEGLGVAVAAGLAAGLAAVAVLVLLPLATLRLTRAAGAHRRASTAVVLVLGVAWGVARASGWQVADDGQVASARAADRVWTDVRQLREDVADRSRFAHEIRTDPLAREVERSPGVPGLAGKDVLVVFVESYGRVALDDPELGPATRRVLAGCTESLAGAGFTMRSGWLDSPTYGAGSWLAHATLQSGLWVDTQQRYDQLMNARRLTLTDAFGRAGWRTVFALPSVRRAWPEGQRFYRYDDLLGTQGTGYAGPQFGWSRVPDQYALDAFGRLVLDAPDRPPVMAELDLSSSHHPWTPLPRMVPWDELGDGRVFRGQRADQPDEEALLADDAAVRAAYGRSIGYSLTATCSWLGRRPADDDLVVVLLGDHQPHSYVTGGDPDHTVPVSLLARDPAVLEGAAGWGWDDGLRPGPGAPVWPMDAFRDRFLRAFGAG